MVDVFNTGETPEELKEKYNPEGSTLRKAQLRMLEMLLYLDKVCKELNIDYRLDGGNVLGAVRHGGFIPWDDDVDIVIENRRDYNILCEYLLKNCTSQYVLQCKRTDTNYYQHWSVLRDLKSEYIQDDYTHNLRRYRGLQIDIFPLEPARIMWMAKLLSKVSGYNDRYFKGRCKWLADLIWNVEEYILIPVCNAFSFLFGNKNYYMHSYGDGWFSRRHKNILLPHSKIMFEGHEFPAPAKVHEFLESLYKNYMDLPPVDKRNHHKAEYKIWE